jgi:hypothetical protein
MHSPRLVGPGFLGQEKRQHRIFLALNLLEEAHDGACDLELDAWQFAVESHQLYLAGLNNTDLRWLIGSSCVEHRWEEHQAQREARSFLPARGLRITPRSCFILAAHGTELLRQWREEAKQTTAKGQLTAADTVLPVRPHWDALLRQLSWNGTLIKRFRVPAENQETVLAVLEEQHWPVRIDDPLPGALGIDPKARLRETVKSLNRRQMHRLLEFCSDGTGRGLQWRFLPQETSGKGESSI